MELSVLEYNWGTAREDIQRVLIDTASHINRELRHKFDGKINVLNLPEENSPKTYYRNLSSDSYRINLTANDNRWSQFAYQFAHEFCHVLSGHENLRGNPNNWFHESICQLASLFTLRRMGERWPSNPPSPNWADYATSLTCYAKDILVNARQYSPPDGKFDAWLQSNEKQLRSDPYLRKKNLVVAARLLPLFEQQMQGWNVITKLPNSMSRFPKYLSEWKLDIDPEDRLFLEQVKNKLTGM